VPTEPIPARLVAADGEPVTVSGRGLLDAAPARIAWDGRWSDILGWAGPWPIEQRWWDPQATTRKARLQLTTTDGAALLVSCTAGDWSVDAIYD
jgi:protein ImuB